MGWFRRSTQLPAPTSVQPATVPEGTTRIEFVLSLDPSKGRNDQITDAITAASQTVGNKMQDFPKSDPVYTGEGNYKFQTGSIIYESPDKTKVGARVSYDGGRDNILITLEGDSINNVGTLMEKLDKASVHYQKFFL